MIDGNKIKIILGATVKELRKQKGITQEQLAEYLGLQPHSVTKIETGRAFVSSDVLAKLSSYFGVSPSFFFNKKVQILTEENLNYINEIKQLLPTFDNSKLREIYNILLALQK